MSELWVDTFKNETGQGAPDFPKGLTVTGVITATTLNQTLNGDLTVTGNIGVGGTLTYEDVTNIDSIGIITARGGIKIGPSAGIAATHYADGSIRTTGIITASSFVGDGSGLTNAGPTLTNGVNNRVITASSATAIQGEAKLTFDGNTLDIDNGNIGFKIGGNVNSSGRTDNTYKIARMVIPHYHNAEEPMAIMQVASDGTDNIVSHGGSWNGANAATRHAFYTATNDATHTGTERLRIGSSGEIGVAGGGSISYGSAGEFLRSGGTGAGCQWATPAGMTHYTKFTNEPSQQGNVTLSNWDVFAPPLSPTIGTAVSHNSGLFSFPVTGYWQVYANVLWSYNGGATEQRLEIYGTTNNGGAWDILTRQYHWWHNNGSTNYSSLATVPIILDITNISTHKVKFVIAGGPGTANTGGDDNEWYTGCQFIRWGPT